VSGLVPGLSARTVSMVEGSDTALHVGSGDVPVLATPRLLALAEAVCLEAVRPQLGDALTSVGTKVEFVHSAASPVGMHVEIIAELREVDGRRLTFTFTATDQHGTQVAGGTLERTVVNRERFLSRLAG
jgi:fluoroacetyl-CoA thioesterase